MRQVEDFTNLALLDNETSPEDFTNLALLDNETSPEDLYKTGTPRQ